MAIKEFRPAPAVHVVPAVATIPKVKPQRPITLGSYRMGAGKNAVIHELAREVTFNEVRVSKFFGSIAKYVRMVDEHGGYSLSTREVATSADPTEYEDEL